MLRVFITIIYIIVCAALSTIVLMQEGKMRGLGTISGGAPTNTFWEKAKSRSKEGRLKKLTYVLAVLFFALSIMLSMHPFH